MTLDQAQKILRSLPPGDQTLPAVLMLIRARRAEALIRHKLPPSKLPSGDREFESGAFTALDDLGEELQRLQGESAPPAR